jgi:succinate-semialdehyde dehydrogenase/glutarate-semialdehyde dehydrogenase
MNQPAERPTPVASPDVIVSINPNTGETLGQVPVASEQDVVAAVGRARAAQAGWAALPLRERLRVLRQVQETFIDHADEIAALVSREMGKTETEALVSDVMLTLASLAGTRRLAPRTLRRRQLPQAGLHLTKRTYVVFEPWGVVGIISPFNFPVLLAMQSAFAALIAGNAVVHKPSELTLLSALHIRALLLQAGLPEDLYHVVPGYGATGRALIESGVNYIVFVGSEATGRRVAAAAGERLIPATLELGGNNAMLVLEDAPLERSVDAALTYAFSVSGQMCGSNSRVFVVAPVAERFLALLQERYRRWRVSTDVGPGRGEVTALVDEHALARVEAGVSQALAAGARTLGGGRRWEATSAPVFLPTILIDTRPDMEVMQKEVFGPVMTVAPVDDEQEAIRRANDTPYGLTASVWSRDERRAWAVARRLQVGSVAVNDHLWPFFAPNVPWGGVKASGMGRVGGEWGLRSMTFPKVVSFDRLVLRREFYWPPISARIHRVFRNLLPLMYSGRPGRRLQALGKLVRDLLRR